MKNFTYRFIVVLIVLSLTAGTVFAKGNDDRGDYPYGGGHMMMNGRGHHSMGGWYGKPAGENAERLTLDEAADILDTFVKRNFGDDFYIEEIMEFEWNFYAEIGRQGEDYLAMEVLIDPYSGDVYPEYGPNMMWNRSYGHMSSGWNGNRTADTYSEAEAFEKASEYVADYSDSITVDSHGDAFDGYYTFHTLDEKGIEGMLSVNSVTGRVWYHDWHGPFIAVRHFGDEDAHDE